MFDPFAFDRHHGLNVADAGGHADDDRDFVVLGEGEGPFDHFVGFLGIRRLQDRQVAKAAPVAGILLVLRGGQPHVVGYHDDQPADHAGQRLSHEGVGRDVHADVLHGRQRTRSRQRSAYGDFHCDFFVDRPFGVDVGIKRDVFQDFGGGGARIGGGDPDAGFPGGAGDRFVAGEEMTAFSLGLNHGIHGWCGPRWC